MKVTDIRQNKLVAGLICAFGCWTASYAQIRKGMLLEGQKVQTGIETDNVHQFEVKLKKGQFGLIDVKQIGIDVKIIIRQSDGKQIEEFDSPNGSNGKELVVIDANKEDTYVIEIAPIQENKKKKVGSYNIELVSSSETVEAHLDTCFALINESAYLPGFVVSIVDSEAVRYTNAQGFANIAMNIPYTVNTIQQIESISKTFLGLSLMLLVEEGKLDLNKDINDYLPFQVANPHFPKNPITLKMLATHTSSIDDREHHEMSAWIVDKAVFLENKDSYIHKERRKYYHKIASNPEVSMEDFLQSFLTKNGEDYSNRNFLKNQPGNSWYYSNIGASLAAYVVQLVSGQDYKEFVQERIIRPLQLDSSSWGYDSDESKLLALKYGGGKNEYPRIYGPTYPDGDIYSSTIDLTRYLKHWIRAYNGDTFLLGSDSYKEIMSIQYEETKGNYKGIKNGLFWWIFNNNRMGHNGGNMGTNANMFFYPNLGVGYTSLENMSYGESDGAIIQSQNIKMLLNRYMKNFGSGD